MFSVSELFWPFLLQSNQLVFLHPAREVDAPVPVEACSP
jgi:hypothetical protein